MKKEKVKPLPMVTVFIDYFVRRAKRVLGLTNADFKTVSIDVHPERGTIWVWFHVPESVLARAQFYFDGQCYTKWHNEPEEKGGTE